LHHFQDITTFTVYMTASACDLTKHLSVSLSTVKLQAMYAFQFVCKHILVSIFCIFGSMGFRLTVWQTLHHLHSRKWTTSYGNDGLL